MLAACSGPPAEPGELSIGVREADGSFRALADGDDLRISLLGGRIVGMEISLATPPLDPIHPDVEITVLDEDQLIGANLTEFGPYTLEAHGDGFALWDTATSFQVDTCCFLCRELTIAATIVDSTGLTLRGQVTGTATRGSCPDAADCCADATDCPMPERTRVCM